MGYTFAAVTKLPIRRRGREEAAAAEEEVNHHFPRKHFPGVSYEWKENEIIFLPTKNKTFRKLDGLLTFF